jgi:hypothetical protein
MLTKYAFWKIVVPVSQHRKTYVALRLYDDVDVSHASFHVWGISHSEWRHPAGKSVLAKLFAVSFTR